MGLTTAAGAYIGHQRGLDDVVTVKHVPYQETVRVAVGSHVQQGCHQYHYGYDAMKGEFGYHYGYDASCRQTMTDYETRYTGCTLFKEAENHSAGFPHSAMQGALLGAGVGVITGAAGLYWPSWWPITTNKDQDPYAGSGVRPTLIWDLPIEEEDYVHYTARQL